MMSLSHQPAEFKLGRRILEPKAFCERYARMKEGEYRYKGNWSRLLAHALEVSVKTVETWGTAPDYPACPDNYKRALARLDALLNAERVLKEHGLTEEYLKTLE